MNDSAIVCWLGVLMTLIALVPVHLHGQESDWHQLGLAETTDVTGSTDTIQYATRDISAGIHVLRGQYGRDRFNVQGKSWRTSYLMVEINCTRSTMVFLRTDYYDAANEFVSAMDMDRLSFEITAQGLANLLAEDNPWAWLYRHACHSR